MDREKRRGNEGEAVTEREREDEGKRGENREKRIKEEVITVDLISLCM